MFYLPVLKFNPSQVRSLISPEALFYHYEKHHAGYVEKTNELLQQSEFKHFADQSLEEICKMAVNPLADQARQAWNHTFYWDCISSQIKEPKINPLLEEAVGNSFSSFLDFETEFKDSALSIFGSGWLWLVYREKDKKLAFVKAQGSDQPFWENAKPILVCDVWEHAYYIEFRNERKAYIEAFWSHINWEFAEANLVAQEIYSATKRMSENTLGEKTLWKAQEFQEKRWKNI